MIFTGTVTYLTSKKTEPCHRSNIKSKTFRVKTKIIYTLFQRISRLQEKVLHIINFKRYDTLSDTLFKEKKILKISDFFKYKNTVFVRKCLQSTKRHKMKKNMQIFYDISNLLATFYF